MVFLFFFIRFVHVLLASSKPQRSTMICEISQCTNDDLKGSIELFNLSYLAWLVIEFKHAKSSNQLQPQLEG